MKKILILVDKMGEKRELFVKHITTRVGTDVNITLALFSDLYFSVSGKDLTVEINKIPITGFDLVCFRHVGGKFSVLASTLAICLQVKGVKLIDSVWSEIGPLGSKFTSLVKLGVEGLPIMKTIYVWQTKIPEETERITRELGFPLVAKELSMQRGKGVFKIDSVEDIANLPLTDSKGRDNQFMFQEYKDLGEEYRVLVLGRKVGVWEKKIVTVAGEFRHNVSLGAREEFMKIEDIPADLAKIAIDAAVKLNLQIAGVDIAVNKNTGKYCLIEVNRGPGFTYDTKVSPEMDQIAKFLREESESK
ncbi:MAG: Alpha-L-glutamate ligase, RimK family [Candidatus Woesebacteria bacterium GW2011_GWA2_40_7b]|uniref:Alpha-L-glutamate ligase, RimK family n=1 Tax=Candidatus Woesebacteria bacterium GW2011_GWA2_40_7b TaxID=1618563 RepID=A0A0G0W807_9BACT|nr:MAG: Alpha-L-glutamate ligase, RimK family [Candidatus Woesebacteria bacterium GW2011_GWA2_40_7b]